MSKITRCIVPMKVMRVKLRNRRVTGGLMYDGSILWRFRSLHGKEIRDQKIRLTAEAVLAMYTIMQAFAQQPKAKDGEVER